jgi:hypothetical protein
MDDTMLNQNILPRGCFPISFAVTHNITGGGTDTSLTSTNVADTWSIVATVTVTEPLFLSPFANSENDKAGFLGLNNLVLNINIDNSCRRLWSSATGYITNIPLSSFTNSRLLMNFLSLQPEQYSKISAKNVLPYLDMPRFLWQVGTIPPLNPAGALPTNLITPSTQGQRVTFNNIQLNQIPDLMIICCRQQMSTQNWNNSSYFLSINGISINFNNQSGILSSANSTQLFLMSQKNGSSQTYTEWNGQGFASDSATGIGVNAPTMGSLLILNPAIDFGLLSMYTASSAGQYNFQFELNVTNQTLDPVPAEICLICVNSGMFITENGTSSTQTGILTKELVLNTKSQSGNMDSNMYQRIIGGSLKKLRQLPFFGKSSDSTTGSAMCAGEESAGDMSAGKMKHKLHRFVKK